LAPAPVERLRPPAGMSESAAAVFIDIVTAHDAKFFLPSDAPLLASYATAIATEREALAHLEHEGWVVNNRPNGWVVIKEKCFREILGLSARLRLCPQSRDRIRVKKDRVSLYEKMMLGGDGDEA
jgi:DNA-binding GntR family transcriptional regulator